MDNIKITIIIPVYNAERFLAACLDSCLNQSPFVIGEDYEIICVDDGSIDKSPSILEQYRDRGVISFRQENSGVSVARNTGLDLAKGEYIQFVDSDDCIQPGMLSAIYEKLKETTSDGCSFRTKIVSESFDVSILRPIPMTFDSSTPQLNNVYSLIINKKYLNSHNIRFNPALSYSEDTLFVYYIRLYKHTFINVSDPLYFYRQVATSAMHIKSVSTQEKYLHSSLIMLNEFKHVLDNWDAQKYAGDAMTQERYYWTIQNILFSILRLDKLTRYRVFRQMEEDGHYPYPIQWKRLFVDSRCIQAVIINSFSLFFPIRPYYKLLMKFM